jgi:hypothetical protein
MQKKITPDIVEKISAGQQAGVVQAALSFYELNPDADSHYLLNEGHDNLIEGAAETQKRGVAGSALETVIAIVLVKEGIRPFYTQAEVAFVHNAKYDIFLYGEDRTLVTLSLKTSFRERWKQADLEAFALAQVYKKCLSMCATFDSREACVIKEKIAEGRVFGLHHCFDLTLKSDVSKMLEMLKSKKPVDAPEQLGPMLTRKIKI